MFRWVNDEGPHIANQYTKVLSGKYSMILRVTINGYCCLNGVYRSTCEILLVLVLIKMWFSDISWSVVAIAMDKTCISFSVSKASTLPSAISSGFFVARLSFDASRTINIGPSYELYGTIFLSAGKLSSTNLSVINVPSRIGTAMGYFHDYV